MKTRRRADCCSPKRPMARGRRVCLRTASANRVAAARRQRRELANASIAASMGWCGPIRQPAPATGTNKASPPPSTSRTAKNRTGRPGCPAHQSDEQSRRADNRTKRAQIGKASGCTHRLFRPDAVRYMSVTTATHRPTVTRPDTRRDKKETAHGAAFPQPRGRFRRWWQVLGSNQRRLSRRFYRPRRLRLVFVP